MNPVSHIKDRRSQRELRKQKSTRWPGKKKEKFVKRFLGKVCSQTIQMQKEMDDVFDKIEWVSVDEGKPCGYIIDDQEAYYKEPAEYLVHVKGAEYPAFAMFFDGEFVPCRTDGVGGFAGEIDYWAEKPRWKH